jgi:hypothetical protein
MYLVYIGLKNKRDESIKKKQILIKTSPKKKHNLEKLKSKQN